MARQKEVINGTAVSSPTTAPTTRYAGDPTDPEAEAKALEFFVRVLQMNR